MNPQDPRELEIIHSWHCNAAPWSEAIRTASFASRRLVTNQAVIEAVSSVAARAVLDIGCGEGWLARALSAIGMRVTGVDAVPELIARAVALSAAAPNADAAAPASFRVQDYASLANRQWHCDPFDAAVCNFSLLGKESVDSLIAALPFYLRDPGYLIIQTLHPVAACGELPYEDGWREGNWVGFSADFHDPAPWYFRTLDSWTALLQGCGFDILERREPKAFRAAAPASVVWIGKTRRSVQT